MTRRASPFSVDPGPRPGRVEWRHAPQSGAAEFGKANNQFVVGVFATAAPLCGAYLLVAIPPTRSGVNIERDRSRGQTTLYAIFAPTPGATAMRPIRPPHRLAAGQGQQFPLVASAMRYPASPMSWRTSGTHARVGRSESGHAAQAPRTRLLRVAHRWCALCHSLPPRCRWGEKNAKQERRDVVPALRFVLRILFVLPVLIS